MIAGVGIDLLELERCAPFLARHRDLSRVLGPRELERIGSGGPPAREAGRLRAFASCFCAKEAFAKALGTGMRGFALYEVELTHGPLGRPCLALSGRALALCRARGLCFQISITHTERTAAAFVIAEGPPAGAAASSAEI